MDRFMSWFHIQKLLLFWFHQLKLPPPDSYCFGFINWNSRLRTHIVMVSSTETPAPGLILFWFHRLKLPPPDSYSPGPSGGNMVSSSSREEKRENLFPLVIWDSRGKSSAGGVCCIFPQSTDMHGLPAANTKEIIHCPCAAGAKLYCTQCTA